MQSLVEFLIYQPWWAIYAIIFVALLACGLGLPMPEDLILFTMGYCAYNGLADLRIGIVVCMVGVLIGDSSIYYFGRYFGERMTRRWPFKTVLPPERMERTRALFLRWGNKVIFLARFMPGLRAPVYFSAGTLRLPFRIFFSYDLFAATISVPLLTYAMYRFGGQVDLVIKKAHEIQGGVAALILVGILFLTVKHQLAKKRR